MLFSALVKEGHVVPGNSHFDTTKGHIESRKAFAVDCTIDEAKDTQLEHPFKGNVDIEKLEKTVSENPGNVPFIIVTVTTTPQAASLFPWPTSAPSANSPTATACA